MRNDSSYITKHMRSSSYIRNHSTRSHSYDFPPRVSDPNPHNSELIWVAGSGSSREKWPTKIEKNHKFHVLWCSLLRDEGFSCSLGVLYEVFGIRISQFVIKKNWEFFSAVKFFSIFGHQNTGSGSEFGQMLDPDPHLINADPKPCFHRFKFHLLWGGFPRLFICVYCVYLVQHGNLMATLLFQNVSRKSNMHKSCAICSRLDRFHPSSGSGKSPVYTVQKHI
jgi:hypothetical protein